MKTPKDNELEPLFREILSFRPRTQENRMVKILTAAIDLLAEKGVDEVTFESIGKRAKMVRSHVVYYFKTRDELIDAAIEFVAFSAQRIIASSLMEVGSGEELLENYINANFEWLERHPKHATVMLLIYYEGGFKKRRREFHSGIRETGRKRLEAILRLIPSLEKIGPAKRETLARTIQAVLTGTLIEAFTTNLEKSNDSLRQETIGAARKLVESFS